MIVDIKTGDVIWHSKRKFTGMKYSIEEYMFSPVWEPSGQEFRTPESKEFMKIIEKTIKS
jgi:hypothetical protein